LVGLFLFEPHQVAASANWPRADPGQKRVLGEWIARLGLDLGWPVTEGWAKAPDGCCDCAQVSGAVPTRTAAALKVVGTTSAFTRVFDALWRKSAALPTLYGGNHDIEG
jgi:hypothetical protein